MDGLGDIRVGSTDDPDLNKEVIVQEVWNSNKNWHMLDNPSQASYYSTLKFKECCWSAKILNHKAPPSLIAINGEKLFWKKLQKDLSSEM